MAAESAVRIIFLGDSAQAVRSVRQLEGAMGGLGRTTKLVAGAMGIALVGGLVGATSAAIDFDRSMRNVNSIAKLSEKQFQALSKEVLALGKTTGQTPKVLADGLYDIVSSGFKANDAIKILAVSAKAATAGLTDTATSSKAVVAILNAYHLSADRAKNVSSLLFTEVNKGVNTFEELATNIGDTAPLAASLKIPFSDVAAGLALITLHGTSMAEASTQMSRVMADLLKPSKDLKAELHSLGYENGQAAIEAHGFIPLIAQLSKEAKGSSATTAEWFQNIRSLRGMLNLTGPNLQKFNQFADEMAKSFEKGGADTKAFNEQAKSISVQWAMAKSAIIAAAIPIGQLLFPALIKGADAAQRFANALTEHMPQIRSDFQALGGVLSTVGAGLRTLGIAAITPVGSATLLGVLAGAGSAKLLTGLSGLAVKAGESSVMLTRLGIAGMAVGTWAPAAAIGIGALTTAIIIDMNRMNSSTEAMRANEAVLKELTGTSQSAAQAHLNLSSAQVQVKQTGDQVTAAEKTLQAAIRQSGKNSEAANVAEHNLAAARVAHKQAILNEKNATEENTKAQAANTKQMNAAKAKIADLFSTYSKLATVDSSQIGVFADQMAAVARQAATAAKNIPNTERAAKLAAEELARAAQAASALARELGRIPTRKDIRVYYQQINEGPGSARFGGPPRRAAGGFIPGPAPGAPVPILAHAGEVILNQQQQMAFGGPHAIARMFGFTGSEGPGFATGGIVNTRAHHHHPVRPRYKTARRRARGSLKAIDHINQEEEDLDRAYGQLQRQYQVDGTLDVNEIDSLIAERNKMLALLEEEKKELVKAIKDLKKAIAAMVAAVKAERKMIAATAKKMADEQKKKKPNAGLITRYQNAISAGGTRIGNLQSSIGDFQRSLADENLNLKHQLPFDVRDVQLDISELQQERKTTSTAAGPDVAALIAEIARLTRALDIQGAQQAVIGTFAKGTLSVPETGLALVHAGEQIIPAGQVRGSTSAALPPVVNLYVDDAMGWLKPFIRAEAVNASDAISVRIGQRATERARSGRY